MNLTEISKSLDLLCDSVDAGEELTNDFLQVFADMREQHENKLTAYKSVMDMLKRESAYYSERSETLKRKAKMREAMLEKIKTRLVEHIEQFPDLPWASLDGEKFRAQENPPKLELFIPLDKRSFSNIVISPDERLTRFLTKVEFYTLQTDEVKQALLEGQTFEWARLADKTKHLRVY